MRCRLCDSGRMASIVDLGATPPCEKFLTVRELDLPEPTYPLHVRLCEECLLLQLPALIAPEETFTRYAYYSSYSDSWVRHAHAFVDAAVFRLGLDADSLVLEVASNDGYLLQHLVRKGIRCLGIEPSVNVGAAARAKGLPTLTGFLDPRLAEQITAVYGPARLVVANNVYAHVPDVRGFSFALRELVADDGWVSIEVHHALNLVRFGQFDTIYHEHFQYYTLISAQKALATAGLAVVDVELLPTQGGSMRIWARPEGVGRPSAAVEEVLWAEMDAGLYDVAGYRSLGERAVAVRQELLGFLLEQRAAGKRVVGYGAPGKGNTLLNYCGIRSDLLAYTVDRNPFKQGKFTPGTRIPIHSPERIDADRPDVVVVLPWNLREEITAQLAHIAAWGGELVFPLPELQRAGPGTGGLR
ncbi:methyltransferase domain-containing protein [Nocardia sp. NPDC088792]|uniref:methyltransferase domain-containing protein n=1 Tax=Nocardia sp. NPDC088792 TaxID=3364332 RepID=UPI00382D7A96